MSLFPLLSFVLNEIYILTTSCAGEEKQQKLCCASWILAPSFWGCLNAVCCRCKRNTEGFFKPWCSARKPCGQGSKQKILQTGWYYPKDGIYLMNLHSLPITFGHLLDLMKVSIMCYTVESLFSLIHLRHVLDIVKVQCMFIYSECFCQSLMYCSAR